MTNEYSPKKVSYIYRAGTTGLDGLPNSDRSFKLPLSAIITDVKIVFLRNPGNGANFDISVTNFDGSEVFVQGSQAASANNKTYSSSGLAYLIMFFARENSPFLQRFFPRHRWGIFLLT